MKRYPNLVCDYCCKTGVFASNSNTADRIEFSNVDIGEQHECYIKGRKCYANEYRFGGIVISYI
tara:strand:+ start:455 stop:646 length:192 start_codon:yes stop_codon:yes gene_type:complete